MKAEIITEEVYEGALAWTHGMSFPIQRIIIPEANNLAITPLRANLYIWDNFEKKGSCKIIKKIEIADELVEKAVEFMKTRNILLREFEEFVENKDT